MTRAYLIDSRFAGLRTNLHPNPSVKDASDYWTYSTAAGAVVGTVETSFAGTTGKPPGATGWYKATSTVPLTSSQLTIDTSVGGTSSVPIKGSTEYTFSLYAASSWAGYTDVMQKIEWATSNGSWIDPDDFVPQFALAAPNVWERRVRTVTSPPTAVYARSILTFRNPQGLPVGGWAGVTGVLIEKGPAARPFFDGSFRNAKWSGTPGDSSSVGYGFVGVI